MARSKQRSGKKNGSPKSDAAAPSKDRAEASQSDEAYRRTLKRTIIIAAVLGAVIVAAAGVGFYFLNDSKSTLNNSRDRTVASFVGSETCAGCHRAQAELWHTSQHKHAMDHATDKSVLGDFSDATFDY